MKNKIIEAKYYEDSGVAYLAKATKYGIYKNWMVPDIEDEDIATKWDGLAFAEYKCDLEYMNEHAKRMYERYLGARDAYNALKQNTSVYNETMEKLAHQVQVFKRNAKQAREKYKFMKEAYKAYTDSVLQQRHNIRQSIMRKKANSKEEE